ncbi:hypothetical protein [Sporomusa aerivorans]|uniref:hypothetical protein n=1 Tax=Sporomusa aerivorans TaxID=204936 RepID=UPI00352BA197
MAGTRLAVTTVDQNYGWFQGNNYTSGLGKAGVLRDETTAIGVEGNKVTDTSGDTRNHWFQDGSVNNKLLLFQSRYQRKDDGSTTTLAPTIEIRDAKTWALTHNVNQPTDWPSILNVYGAVSVGSYLYPIDFDSAKIARIPMTGSSPYVETATYTFTNPSYPADKSYGVALSADLAGNKLYGLFITVDNLWAATPNYQESTVVEIDLVTFTETRRTKRVSTVDYNLNLGRNAFTLERHGSKLYVCSIGGKQGGGAPNPNSKLDVIDLANTGDPTGLAFTTAFMADEIVGELRDITFTNDGNAYVLAGHYLADYTNFNGHVLQFPAANVEPEYLTGIYFFPTIFPNQGAVFAVLANDNNRIWLARGMYVDLCAQEVSLGEALTLIQTKAAYEINGPANTYYLNSVTLYGEDPSVATVMPLTKHGYQAPAFASNSVQALFERQRFIREEEARRQAIRARIVAGRKK